MLYERIKLEDDEQIIKTVRKHWWVIFSNIVFSMFMILLPVIVLVIVESLTLGTLGIQLNIFIYETYPKHVLFVYCLWVLLNWMILANAWTDHYLDLWTITNRRIVSIDQRGFFHRFLSSFRLERLQDMNIEVKGILPTLLNFGTIEAQTAGGSNEEFKTSRMPDPRGLKAMIIQAADERQQLFTRDPNQSEGI